MQAFEQNGGLGKAVDNSPVYPMVMRLREGGAETRVGVLWARYATRGGLDEALNCALTICSATSEDKENTFKA